MLLRNTEYVKVEVVYLIFGCYNLKINYIGSDIEQGSTAYFSLTPDPDRTWVEYL